ncbi:uncharacterized protein LOC111259168 isoform X1 [Varroa jacobsoni]|uniref:uncharacterized protein LOC111259168 isoform X1 n=1 Tax=Varroa jacobsoni TaxID=62625 RepID=UPI000BF72364|nr:uncharacterized protein LOC111259168 isoform X1 [Varroa jacobsoni]
MTSLSSALFVSRNGIITEGVTIFCELLPRTQKRNLRVSYLCVSSCVSKSSANLSIGTNEMAASSFALGDGTTSPEAVQRLEEQQRVYLSTVANLQIDSLVKDLNRIRFAFHATNSVRFEHFATVFRTLKATKLFQGFGNELSARVFVEDVYEVLIRELEDTDSFTDKAFIVYMLFATYFCQICRPRTPMRVRLSDLERLESFADVCQQDNHLDLVFAIRRLQTESAFHFVHSLRPYAFKSYMLDPQQLTHRKLKLANRIAGHRNLLQSTDLFRRLEFVHDKYCELKISLGLTPSSSEADTSNPFPEMRDKIRSVPAGDKSGSRGEFKEETLPGESVQEEDQTSAL